MFLRRMHLITCWEISNVWFWEWQDLLVLLKAILSLSREESRLAGCFAWALWNNKARRHREVNSVSFSPPLTAKVAWITSFPSLSFAGTSHCLVTCTMSHSTILYHSKELAIWWAETHVRITGRMWCTKAGILGCSVLFERRIEV